MAIATTNLQRFQGRRPAAPRRKVGTWKMAYADFLTALMAFFLMLWLVSGVSPDSRTMIADYFTGKDTATVSGPLVEIRRSETLRLFERLRTDEALSAAGDNLRIVQEVDGIRLNLVDTESRPLFASESGALTEAGAELTRQLGQAISGLASPVTIEGHTDAFPSLAANRTNWDISSERANAARRILVASGVSDDRVRAVTGLADTRPLNPGEPHLSVNRRISILLHSDG
jgi:chemotaxis protein MotB